MKTRIAAAWVVTVTVTAGAAQAAAQAGPAAGPAGRIEIAAAVTVAASADLGGGAASLTPNLGGATFTLFSASATYASPVGAELRLAYRVKPWLLVGVSGALARGDVRVRIAGDAEGGPSPSFAGETLGQALVEGRVDVLVTRLQAWQGRLTPYGTVSGGLLRHWHTGNVIIETGSVIQAGAGIRYNLANRPKARLSRVGLSAEVRMTRSSGGFNWGREHRTVPSARLEFLTGWGH
jgi:hypothetical protein